MRGPEHDEIVKSMVELLLSALPDDKARIVATGETDLGHSTSSLSVIGPDGTVTAAETVPDLDLTVIRLWDDTAVADTEPWNAYTLTVEQDGTFALDLSYVSPDPEPDALIV
jgi:hypothetical protein